MSTLMQAMKAGVLYFAIVFAVGFALGAFAHCGSFPASAREKPN